MARGKAKKITLYLTPLQKNMVSDFAGKKVLRGLRKRELSKVLVTWRPGGCLPSYRLPPDGMRKGDWLLYLTEEQGSYLTEAFGLKKKITSINVSPENFKAGDVLFA